MSKLTQNFAKNVAPSPKVSKTPWSCQIWNKILPKTSLLHLKCQNYAKYTPKTSLLHLKLWKLQIQGPLRSFMGSDYPKKRDSVNKKKHVCVCGIWKNREKNLFWTPSTTQGITFNCKKPILRSTNIRDLTWISKSQKAWKALERYFGGFDLVFRSKIELKLKGLYKKNSSCFFSDSTKKKTWFHNQVKNSPFLEGTITF